MHVSWSLNIIKFSFVLQSRIPPLIGTASCNCYQCCQNHVREQSSGVFRDITIKFLERLISCYLGTFITITNQMRLKILIQNLVTFRHCYHMWNMVSVWPQHLKPSKDSCGCFFTTLVGTRLYCIRKVVIDMLDKSTANSYQSNNSKVMPQSCSQSCIYGSL